MCPRQQDAFVLCSFDRAVGVDLQKTTVRRLITSHSCCPDAAPLLGCRKPLNTTSSCCLTMRGSSSLHTPSRCRARLRQRRSGPGPVPPHRFASPAEASAALCSNLLFGEDAVPLSSAGGRDIWNSKLLFSIVRVSREGNLISALRSGPKQNLDNQNNRLAGISFSTPPPKHVFWQ